MLLQKENYKSLLQGEIGENLINESINLNSLLVTTQKDYIKIAKKYQNKIFSFSIDMEFSDYATLDSMLYSIINVKSKK